VAQDNLTAEFKMRNSYKIEQVNGSKPPAVSAADPLIVPTPAVQTLVSQISIKLELPPPPLSEILPPGCT